MEYDTTFLDSVLNPSPCESIYDFNLDNDIQTLKKRRKSVVTLV